MPRCFRGLRDPSRPASGHCFSNPKAWMTSDIMLAVLQSFNRNLLFEQRKVILYLDNTAYHLESMIDSFSQMKIIFLPKNKTSRLQPFGAGIIQNFKVKHRKRLVKYVYARINENSSATPIIKNVDILMAIQWAQEAWKEVTGRTIKIVLRSVGWSKVIAIWWNLRKMTKPQYVSRRVRLFRPPYPNIWAYDQWAWNWLARKVRRSLHQSYHNSNVSDEAQETSDPDNFEEEDDM